jgi:hypothetical protein
MTKIFRHLAKIKYRMLQLLYATIFAESEEPMNSEAEVHDRKWRRLQRHRRHIENYLFKFPFTILAIAAYLVIGFSYNVWHPSWLVFLLIPVWYSLVDAVSRKNARLFLYPVVVVIFYLTGGLVYGIWHPTWVAFITIPVYYSLVSYIQGQKRINIDNNTNV